MSFCFVFWINFPLGLRYLEDLSWVESKKPLMKQIQLFNCFFLFLMCQIGVGCVMCLVQVENREQNKINAISRDFFFYWVLFVTTTFIIVAILWGFSSLHDFSFLTNLRLFLFYCGCLFLGLVYHCYCWHLYVCVYFLVVFSFSWWIFIKFI